MSDGLIKGFVRAAGDTVTRVAPPEGPPRVVLEAGRQVVGHVASIQAPLPPLPPPTAGDVVQAARRFAPTAGGGAVAASTFGGFLGMEVGTVVAAGGWVLVAAGALVVASGLAGYGLGTLIDRALHPSN